MVNPLFYWFLDFYPNNFGKKPDFALYVNIFITLIIVLSAP